MVLVVSEEEDMSTDNVVEWLSYFKIPFLRINKEKNFNILSSVSFTKNQSDIFFNIKGKKVNINDIDIVWFRRGEINISSLFVNNPDYDTSVKSVILKQLRLQDITLLDYITTRLKEKKHINTPEYYNSSKLVVLETAKNVGLHIPDTLITTSKKELLNWIGNKNRLIITKPIQDCTNVVLDGINQVANVVSYQDIATQIPEYFHYSLFQEKIDIEYELRIFFIADLYFASAIFSYAESGFNGALKTKMNRIVPFELPGIILRKLKRLNKLLRLNSGSIDMIVDKGNKYYFLEVNPVGQYDYISYLCNYNLDKRIAEYILKMAS